MAGPQWLESISEVTGLDPLGVQAISIKIYGYLLPGISNVTNRLRYYSFLCWVLYNYSKEGGSSNLEEWRQYIRKSEFLFSLISDVHHEGDHGYSGSMVGSKTSTPLITKHKLDIIDLNKHTKYEESHDRYFKNKGGGFAQYYKGPMENMKLVMKGGPLRIQLADDVKKTGETRFGVKAALAFSENSNLELFHRCVTKGKVSKHELSLMAESLCACRLMNNSKEYTLLTNLMFDVNKNYKQAGSRRRKTFCLILQFMKNTGSHGLSVDEFRNICMYRHFANGQPIKVSTHYNDVLSIWHIYQTHEYFCYALQCYLYAFERIIEFNSASFDQVAAFIFDETTKNLLSLPDSLKAFSKAIFSDAVKLDAFINSIVFSNSYDSQWFTNNISEFCLKNNIDEFVKLNNVSAILRMASILLIKIHLKTRSSNDFYNYGEMLNYKAYTANINALNKMIKNKISAKNDLWDFIFSILKEFVVDRHTIVALWKFRGQKKSTLRYRIENNAYVRTSKIKYDDPDFTNPRLQQTFRFLEDMGMAERKDNKKYVITQTGERYLAGVNEL